MLECGSELGAIQGQVRMGNVGEAGADHAVEDARPLSPTDATPSAT